MSLYKAIIRPILFQFQPETIHHLISKTLSVFFKLPLSKIFFRFYNVHRPSLEREVFGLSFKSPVGLAAGFDKDAHLYHDFSAFGFGFIEIGTVTPVPQPGNPKPRSFRLPKDKAVINRMGFNNLGVDEAILKLKNRPADLIIGGNIGKNTATPNELALNDYAVCFEKLYPWVDYFVINISCPNIGNLAKLQNKDELAAIMEKITAIRKTKSPYRPVLIKISPDLNARQIDEVLEIIGNTGIDGVVATNTTISREGLSYNNNEIERIGNGGLSGAPLTKRSTEVIKYIHEKTGGKLPIIGVGGIMTPQDALDKINAGAALIQVYTGFIYEGPAFVSQINKFLSKKIN